MGDIDLRAPPEIDFISIFGIFPLISLVFLKPVKERVGATDDLPLKY